MPDPALSNHFHPLKLPKNSLNFIPSPVVYYDSKVTNNEFQEFTK